MGGYLIVIICIMFLTGCSGMQVNVPVEFQSVKREAAALLVLVENKSARQIRITYPVSTGVLTPGQYTIFHVPGAGNYKVVVTAYAEGRRYRDIYAPFATTEAPIFLNGYDLIRAKGNFVGYYLEITEEMLFRNR